MRDLEDISRRLDVISRELKATAKKQDTISKLLELLVVHIPDVDKGEDGDVSHMEHSRSLPCLCQVTLSDLKVGG
ncbi:MAG: hypothetical protein AAFQ15_01820 [Pseudomonadota bacterium]